MKPVIITIEQDGKGENITDIKYDVDFGQGCSASNVIALMIKEGLDDPTCVEIMRNKAFLALGMDLTDTNQTVH